MTTVQVLVLFLLVLLVGGNFVQRDGQPFLGIGPAGGGFVGLIVVVLLVMLFTGNL